MDLVISQAVWWAPVAILAGMLAIVKRQAVGWHWLAAAITVFAIYCAAVFWLPEIDGFPTIEGAQFNWTGKLCAIAATIIMSLLALLAFKPITRETLGLTLAQREGSLLPAAIATLAMIALVVVLQMLGGDGARPTVEALAFQATIPGIDEEVLFRGLLLGLLALGFARFERKMLWAGIAATIVFTLGHSFFWTQAGSQFDPVALVYVAILGSLLMFIRLRTGSILLPIIAHNLTNVASQLA